MIKMMMMMIMMIMQINMMTITTATLTLPTPMIVTHRFYKRHLAKFIILIIFLTPNNDS